MNRLETAEEFCCEKVGQFNSCYMCRLTFVIFIWIMWSYLLCVAVAGVAVEQISGYTSAVLPAGFTRWRCPAARGHRWSYVRVCILCTTLWWSPLVRASGSSSQRYGCSTSLWSDCISCGTLPRVGHYFTWPQTAQVCLQGPREVSNTSFSEFLFIYHCCMLCFRIASFRYCALYIEWTSGVTTVGVVHPKNSGCVSDVHTIFSTLWLVIQFKTAQQAYFSPQNTPKVQNHLAARLCAPAYRKAGFIGCPPRKGKKREGEDGHPQFLQRICISSFACNAWCAVIAMAYLSVCVRPSICVFHC